MSPEDAPRIELRGVGRDYGGRGAVRVTALDAVELAIPPGDYLSIEGPSGSGKTTLLNLLGLLDAPSRGEVRWDGRPVGGLSERQRSRLRLEGVGFIFQRFYLLPTLTAQENVELPMRARGDARAERRARALELLEGVGLSERSASFPHELSGGEEQRVGIARALANRPGLLLADEPTGELDRASSELVLDLLESSRRSVGASLVLVTHNPAVARRARRHLTLADGRIAADVREA